MALANSKLLYRILRKAGFKRVYRSQSVNMPHIYERKEGSLTLSVQLWLDGNHRVSHMLNGIGTVLPTDFQVPDQLLNAIADQKTKAQVS